MRDNENMSSQMNHWGRGRGLSRLLARETNISDLIQFLSDRDPSPWAGLVGFIPGEIKREGSKSENYADLVLISDSYNAAIEVKLGHSMSEEQQAAYESHPGRSAYLAALSFDESRLTETDKELWQFLSLSNLIGKWEQSKDVLARLLSSEAATVLRDWDDMISGVFEPPTSSQSSPLSVLGEKFLARVVTRRIALDLRATGNWAWAGVTSGGGLPIVQAWTPIRGETIDRAFIAEIRWSSNRFRGELRFGVDFDPRPQQSEDEEVRRAAYDLAHSMDAIINYKCLEDHLAEVQPGLIDLLVPKRGSGRPEAKGDWEDVIKHGFKGSFMGNGKKNNRRRTTPGFYGDGALRFEAAVDVDFEHASALDLIVLIDATLEYLGSNQPAPI
ncbi:hypothetical protein [Glutamicibacter sp. NPDC127525]|uniref:hypothetical protein n=1 Tax=unclassified Glutamicibacter TaxID=2627139 RepID=UPI0036386838